MPPDADGGAPVTVALDGRGAERGPDVVVAGARPGAADGIAVRVFGDPPSSPSSTALDGVEVIEAPDAIGNDDEPVAAVRSRADASIVRAAADVAEGRSQALASAGPTGATMAAALFALRRMHGSSARRSRCSCRPRPRGPPTLMLDVGANAEARAHDLVQFAYLGVGLRRAVLGVEARASRCSRSARRRRRAPQRSSTPTRARRGRRASTSAATSRAATCSAASADVIVTDGFTGNVALKTIEGTAKAVAGAVRRRGPVESASPRPAAC